MSLTVEVRGAAPVREQLLADAGRLARIMLVAVPLGAVTTGVVARLAMLLLAEVNAGASGFVTDDGFIVNRFTLSGSLNLALAGVFLGALSGVLYAALVGLRTGPPWFRRASLSIGAGVVVGEQLVHTEGVDFVILHPVLLSVGLFVAIPVLHVLVLDLLADRVEGRDLLRGRGWTVAGLCLSLVVAPLVVPLALGRAALLWAREQPSLVPVVTWRGWPWMLRAALAVVFLAAVVSLSRELAELL